MGTVEEYVQRKITIEEDRLPAISGIAREISAQTNMTYIAGLWKEDFHRGLLWTTSNEGLPYTRYIAPSWSWASIQFPKSINYGQLHSLISEMYSQLFTRIAMPIDYEVTPLNGDLYGQIKSASLEINGPMIAASRLYTDDQKPHCNLPPIESSQAVPNPQTPAIQKMYLRSSTIIGDKRVWRYTLLQFFKEAPLHCSFDVRDDLADPSTRLLDNIRFIQIASLRYEDIRTRNDGNAFVFALMLVSTEESGIYQRVGRACFPKLGIIAEKEWERQTISII